MSIKIILYTLQTKLCRFQLGIGTRMWLALEWHRGPFISRDSNDSLRVSSRCRRADKKHVTTFL